MLTNSSFVNKHCTLHSLLQTELDNLSIEYNNELDDSQWTFDIGRHDCTLDFSIFDAKHLQFCKTIDAEIDDVRISLSPQQVAKIIWLYLVKQLSPGSTPYRGAFNGLLFLYAFLFEEDTSALTSPHLERYVTFLLTRNVTVQGVFEKFSPPSYGSRFTTFHLGKVLSVLNRYKISVLVQPIKQSEFNAALNKVCETMLGITAKEYQQGGTFNFLGLEIGKHYIDHCHNVFEEHYIYISALHEALKKCLVDSKCNQIYESKRDSIEAIVMILKGQSPPAYQHRIKARVNNAVPAILNHFRIAYTTAFTNGYVFKLDVINKISKRLKLPDNYDAQEFVRTLCYIDFSGETIKSKNAVWSEYVATLPTDSITKRMELSDFENAVTEVKNDFTQLPKKNNELIVFLAKKSVILSTNVFKSKNYQYKGHIEGAAKNLGRAGTTCLIAALGWRASEFTFTLNDISISINADVLDNYYTPFRIELFGQVPKTGGKTKHRREITLQCLILIKQIAHLKHISSNDQLIFEPIYSLANVVQHWWEDFVDNYKLFKELNVRENKNKLGTDTNSRELLRVRNIVKNQLPRVQISIMHRFPRNLDKYLSNELEANEIAVFERFLTPETKEKIKGGTFELLHDDVLAIRAELLEDTVYPTPHAFRHIWAEAVLRRYRGDIGKFIQANFKHMDSRFFFSYIKGKMATNMRNIFESAERNYINSTVLRHIESMGDERRDYAGQIDRFLSKAVNLTKITTHEEYEALAQKISIERIVCVTPTPWSTCMYKVGTERIARCSENGFPQRQNASPALCLGCINADISAGNFNGIVAYLRSDIEACRNRKLPTFLKVPHLEQLRVARKRVNELYRNSGKEKYKQFLDHLDETIFSATHDVRRQ